jgi:hypothetical protein
MLGVVRVVSEIITTPLNDDVVLEVDVLDALEAVEFAEIFELLLVKLVVDGLILEETVLAVDDAVDEYDAPDIPAVDVLYI